MLEIYSYCSNVYKYVNFHSVKTNILNVSVEFTHTMILEKLRSFYWKQNPAS